MVIIASHRSHVDYLIEVVLGCAEDRDKVRGLELTYEAPYLRHFTAQMRPV